MIMANVSLYPDKYIDIIILLIILFLNKLYKVIQQEGLCPIVIIGEANYGGDVSGERNGLKTFP
jgi:hypothetical protein